MNDMKKLARLIGEMKKQVDTCTQCGLCQSVCPVFAETGRESDVARGKLAILDGLVQEIFKNPKGASDRLNRCAFCGSCAFHCPGNVDIFDIYIHARTIISEFIGMAWYKKIIFRWMMTRPALFDSFSRWIQPFQKIFVKPSDSFVGTSCARAFSPILKKRHFIPLAPLAFHETTSSVNTPPGYSGIKAALFTGCIVDKIFPRIAETALNIFEHHGVGVYVPEGLGCCGLPALTSGDLQSFKQLTALNLDKLDPSIFNVLVTPCATCTFTLKKIWPILAHNEPTAIRDRVNAISAITMDISEFLVKLIGKKLPEQTDPSYPTISYHDPCHLKKSLGVFSEPRMLIQLNTDYNFKEMQEADWCCGMGGSFNLDYYDISTRIGERKRNNIIETGCDVVATGCPACMIQISDMLARAGDKIKVKHTIEIYSESLK